MSKGIYTSLSGAMAQSRQVEALANNLANAGTTGFKKDDLTFREHLSILTDPSKRSPVPRVEFSPKQFHQLHGADKSFATTDASYTDFSQGALKLSNRDLDTAISGPGFFEIATPRGLRYTRNGVFNRSNEGLLVNAQGFPVLSKADAASEDAFTSPESRAIQLENGKVHITHNGDVYVNGNFLASLQVTEFVDGTQLKKEGANLLINQDPTNISKEGPQSQVLQRHLESSNVNPVSEMVRLMEAQRLFEENMKTIKQFDAVEKLAASDLGNF